MNLFISYHFKSKFGDGFGDATISNAQKFPSNIKDINDIKDRIKKDSSEDIDQVVILNIVKLGV